MPHIYYRPLVYKDSYPIKGRGIAYVLSKKENGFPSYKIFKPGSFWNVDDNFYLLKGVEKFATKYEHDIIAFLFDEEPITLEKNEEKEA